MDSTTLAALVSKLDSRQITSEDVRQVIEYAYSNSVVFNWHPLGFIHCLLFSYDGTSLRLHVRPADERRYQEPEFAVHDHIFNMTSYVVRYPSKCSIQCF